MRKSLFGAAVAIVAITVQFLIWPLIPPYPWLLLYPAVSIAGFVAGYSAGFTALLICAIAAWYLFIPPIFSLDLSDPQALTSVGLFTFLGLVMVVMASRGRSSIKTAKASSEAFSGLFERSRDSIFIVDRGGKCVACNAAAAALLGFKADEVPGVPISGLIDGKLIAATRPRDGQKSLPEPGNGIEWTIRGREGRKIVVQASSLPLSEGMWALSIHDISQQRESEASFKAMIEAVFDAILLVDESGVIRYVNQQSSRMFGYSVDELTGKDVEILVPEESRTRHKSIRASYMQSMRPRQIGYDRRLHGQRKDGTLFVVEVGLTPVHYGRDVMVLASVRDVTARTKEVDDLRRAIRARVMFEALCENSSDFIAFSDESGTPIYVNPAGKALVGLKMDYPVQSTSIPDYYPEKLKDFERDVIQKSMARHGRWQGETQLIRWTDKTTIDVSQSRFNIMDPEDGRFLGIGTIVRDISELKASAARAEAANNAKSDFLAMMSHEIRTPLGVILGYADMLFRDATRREDRELFADAIRRNGKHLLALLNDILDLTKVESGRMELVLKPVNLPGVLRELQSFYLAQALSKGLELEFNILGKIPSEIVSDEIRLRQVLINIIGNALKFTATGKVTVDVSSHGDSSQSRQCDILIRVTDTGCGISAADQKKLFQSFVQAGPYIQRKFGGTGLGLALARNLVRKLGGDLTLIQSAPNAGSVFEIRFSTERTAQSMDCDNQEFKRMVVTARDEGKRSLDAREAKSNLPVHLMGLKILLVEDFEDNQIMMKMMLEEAGAIVDVAQNGADAVRMALGGSYDAVLMDIQMPVMNGYDATVELRDCGFDKPIIALTASAMKGELERCLGAGCTNFISKPVQSDELIEMVARYVPGRSRNGEVPEHGAPLAPKLPTAVIRPRISIDDPTWPGVRMIVSRLPVHVAKLKERLAKDEWLELQRMAHQIRGLGGTIGLPEVSDLAAKIEDEIKSGTSDKATLGGLVRQMDELVNRIRD